MKILSITIFLSITKLSFSQISIDSVDFYPNKKCPCDSFGKYLPFPTLTFFSDSFSKTNFNNKADTLIKNIFKKEHFENDTVLIFTSQRLDKNEHYIIIIQKRNNGIKILYDGILKFKKTRLLLNYVKIKSNLKRKKLEFTNYYGSPTYVNNRLKNRCSESRYVFDSIYSEFGAFKYLVFENKQIIYSSEWLGCRVPN